MAFRKRFNQRMGTMRSRMRSFKRPRFKRPRFRSIGMTPFRSLRNFTPRIPRGIPMSYQLNKLMPLALVLAALYFIFPNFKTFVNNIFHKK